MNKSPIWKDVEYNSTEGELDYTLKDVARNQIVHRGYSMRMPDRTGITVSINTRVEEYLDPDFAEDIDDVHNDVVSQPNAFKEYLLQSGDTTLETFDFLYDWSYEENWTGQTGYYMSSTINGRLDPRMKIMNTYYNTGETSFNWTIDYTVNMNFSLNKIEIGVEGSAETMTVFCNDSWQITSKPSWLNVDISAGTGSYSSMTPTTITFSASPNDTDVDKIGYVVFTHSDGTVTIPVVQYGIYLTVTPLYVQFPVSGGTKELEIRYNYKWTKTSDINWIVYGGDQYVELEGKSYVRTMRMTLTASNGTSRKSGEIRFQQGNVTRIVNVEKEGYNLDVSPTSISFPGTGGSQTVSVTANTSWRITTLPSWLTSSINVNNTVPAGITSVTFTAGINNGYVANNGTIVFSYGTDGKKDVDATQETTLSVVPVQLYYSVNGGSRQITVNSSGPFHISGATSPLLSFSAMSGRTGTSQITVNCGPLEDISEFGNYSFVVYNQYKSVTVNVRQGETLSGGNLHTTYIATGSTTQYYTLYSLAYGNTPISALSIDGGPAVYVSGQRSYSAQLSPGIHTVDYVCNREALSKSSPYAYLFSGTTLYTVEDGAPSTSGGTLPLVHTDYLTYVDAGGFTGVYCDICPNLTELKTGDYLTNIELTGCYSLDQSIYLPASVNDRRNRVVWFGTPRGYTSSVYPSDRTVSGPFIPISGFTGSSPLITNDGRGIVQDWIGFSGSSDYTGYVKGTQLGPVACGGLTAYTVPSGIDYIGPMAFVEAPIQKLTIPEGVKEIFGSFLQYSNVSEFNIPSSVTAITAEINNCEWWVRQTGPLCIVDNWLVSTKGFTGTEFIVPEGVIGMAPLNDYFPQNDYYSKSEIKTVLSGVTKVVLPSTLRYLSGSQVFTTQFPSRNYGWNSLNEIYCYAQTPPLLSDNISKAFADLIPYGTLHCPVGSNYNAWKSEGLSENQWTIVYDL